MMAYAFVTNTYNLVQHTKQSRGNFYLNLGTYTPPPAGQNTTNAPPSITVEDAIVIVPLDTIFLIHGWLMWTAWSVLGFLQIASVRYVVLIECCNKSRLRFLGHVVNGVSILIITIVMSWELIQAQEGELT